MRESASPATYAGSRRLSRARSLTRRVCVAENKSDCRVDGRCSRMALSVRAKPISRMRSASSSTSTCRFDTSNPTVWSRCCRSRPGVAIRMFILRRRSCSCLRSLPPMTRPAEKVCCPPMLRSTSKICIASSRVGEITRAPRPSAFDHRCLYSCSSTGMRNASVLPDPVRAAPSTSRPRRAIGTASFWIGVMSRKPARFSPCRVRGERGRSENARSSGPSSSVSQARCKSLISR